MPFRGFTCEISGEPLSPEECIACAVANAARPGQTCHFTAPFLRGMVFGEGGHTFERVGLSVTQLAGCPRSVQLKARHDYYVRPSEGFWAFRGTMAHAMVEDRHNGDRVIAEKRFWADVGGIRVSGQPDVFYPEHGHLVDFKSTKKAPGEVKTYTCRECGEVIRSSQWAVKRGQKLTCKNCGAEYDKPRQILSLSPPQPYSGHVAQLSAYAWLLALNGHTVQSAEVVYFDMQNPVRVQAQLWSATDTNAWVWERLEPFRPGGDPARGPLAGVLQDKGEFWRCEYCVVRGACEDLHSGPVGKAASRNK